MKVKYSGNIRTDILQSKNLTSADLETNGIKYVVPNVQLLDDFLNWHDNIVVFADCDTDGLSAAAICKIYFETFEGYTVNYVIASRDLRGFQVGDVERIKELYPDATGILTVDCGITSVAAVEKAKEYGIDVLITDHHLPQAELPDCPIINPNLGDYTGFREFCGAALIYLCFRQLESDNTNALQYAAIATVADVMPLIKDNRYIVKEGLKQLSGSNVYASIKKFCAKAKLTLRSAKDIGWGVAPLINSASRMGKEDVALNAYVFGSDTALAELLLINENRKEVVAQILEDDAENIQLSPHAVTMLANTDHIGVLGLLAMKLFSTYGLPALVYCKSTDGKYHYSIRGTDVVGFITKLPHADVEGGGHEAAGGLSSMAEAQEIVGAFYKWNEDIYNLPNGSTDGILESTSYISIPLQTMLDKLKIKESFGPYGAGFEEPLFHSTGVKLADNGLTTSKKNRKYHVCQDELKIDYYDFEKKIEQKHLNKDVDIIYRINFASFNFKPVIELVEILN